MLFEHGGDMFGKDIVYDFSSNLNPLGMPGNVKKVLVSSVKDWEKYPDPHCRRLIGKISERENLNAENIVCGNGAADLIYRIAHTLKPRRAVICAPCFSEYEKALLETDSVIITHALSEENGFLLDERIFQSLENGADMLILCTPNNPNGGTISRDLLKKICGFCSEKNIVFLCDECFMDFVKNGGDLSAKNFLNENVIVLKAFTKIYAMAGLRLGYAVFGSAELAERVKRSGQFWSVSAPAQAAGEAALEENAYIERTRGLIEKERGYLTENLRGSGFKVFDSDANFILFKCGFPLDKMLLGEKIMIRNCKSFRGLDENFFRVAVRSHSENSALVSAVGRILNG